MSFGGGFGGFGQNNNAQSSGFGGFGANNNNTTNTTSAFGSNTNTGTFGASNTSGSLFGGGSNTTATGTTGGFGSTGFGANNNTGGAFGSKPAFGSTAATTNTGGGLFGSSTNNTTTSGFGGGFGATNNTTSTFGGGNTGTSMFGGGANKTTFGAAATNTTGGLFGGSNANAATTSNTFGSGFGATNTLGAASSGDPPGTAGTAFQAHQEKEPNSTATNSFQNLLFQDPYKKWSSEELRLADYVQGRRHGNATGGGAFGVSSGFGGFGNNNAAATTNTTGGFGATNTNTGGSLFGGGNTNTATSGFGNTGTAFGAANTNTTGGGVFGNAAAKPAGGLFGNANTQSTTSNLFGGGNTNTATSGFGNTGNAFGATNNNAAGGLFGGGNQQNKPAGGFSFGGGNNTANTTTSAFGTPATNNAFGATNTNTSTGLFGNTGAANTGGGLFNTNANANTTNTGMFGGNNQQQAGSLFNQAKPAGTGLFGGTPAASNTTGMFGNAAQQNTTGFGATNTANAGSLFQQKPAGTTGLFGNTSQPNNAAGGSLFGGGLGSNNQQQAGTSLFSNSQQQKPSLFPSTNNNAGGSLFNSTNNANQGSVFGNSLNQQQNGNSLLGNSQASNAPQGLTANLNDVSAYGSPSLFVNLNGSEAPNPGPLATPVNGSSKPRRSSILPMYKLAPASGSRFATPQKRGFGFSYSTYGTPNGSPASVSSTPTNLNRSLLASTSGNLNKSVSASNLRRSFNTEDSILAPGAFSSSAQTRWYGSTGSKKLVINRDIRSDLFSTPQKDKQAGDVNGSARKLSKRVSFDTSNVEPEDGTPVRKALPAPEEVPTPTSEDATPRQTRVTNGSNGSKTPEEDDARGKQLVSVREEDNVSTPGSVVGFDNAPGKYWTAPTIPDLEKLNRIQRQRVDNFIVGRDNVGYVAFKVPVDISNIDLNDICGTLIQLEPRSATVYPVSAKKPPVGKGLNVPAQISLEQSWPRGGRDKRIASDPKRFNKHVDRLKKIENTTFESYDKDTGVWIFGVEHFTTYGLDDDDDSDEELETPAADDSQAMNFDSGISPMEDDTFEFRRHAGLPGAFDEQQQQALYEDDFNGKPSFLGVSSADSQPNNVQLSLEENEVDMGNEYDVSEDEDLARSSLEQHLAAEQNDASSENGQEEAKPFGTPGGVLRARMRAVKESAGPFTLEVADGDDWTEMLRKTVSPVKRDRQLLKELNESPSKQTGLLIDFDKSDGHSPRKSLWKKSTAKSRLDELAANSQFGMDKGRGFATSIDLMNSLFEKPKPAPQPLRASTTGKGFPKWPYERQDKTVNMDPSEKAYHDAGRPTWGPDETLVVTRRIPLEYTRRASARSADLVSFRRSNVQSTQQEVRLASLAAEPSKKFLGSQDKVTRIRIVDGIPMASLEARNLKDVFHQQDLNAPASIHEKHVWELASVLFDDVAGQDSVTLPHLLRREKLSQFWADLVDQASSTIVSLASTAEEKAVACLAGHRIIEACKHLLDGKNFHLGTLVPLIGHSDAAKKDMREQIKSWQESKAISEFSESVRTIYELLSGNACVCDGMKDVPLEDRLDSFVISKKFGLNWKQSFGLRLWYAIAQNDDLGAAVTSFKDDVDQEREYLPLPWYIDEGIKPLWDDADSDRRQDLLWGLLQLYAVEGADLEAILRPENSQLSPLDMRLSWQLGLALESTGRVSYGPDGSAKADGATIAYASQLTSAGEWLEAVFVLLHLTKATSRQMAIQDHLCRHAGLIGNETSAAFGVLTDKFRIPAAWIWEALALYMRSVKKDAYAEVQCLLRAGSHVEAHRILVKEVAPQAVVERDFASLATLISQFESRSDIISEWSLGGEIYSLFLTLLQHQSKSEQVPVPVLERLLAGLHAMNEDAPESEILRYAAVSDMADVTAKEILLASQQKRDTDLRTRILNLPLTQDRLLAYSVDLGMDRYRAVMSH